MQTIKSLVEFIQEEYRTKSSIQLHAPIFIGREKEYVVDAINSTYVSSVGAYVDKFENHIATYTASKKAIATVNGTAALHMALKLVGVKPKDLVITQPLTFVATCNAISYCGAEPVFVDVDCETLGLSPKAMEEWLMLNAYMDDHGVSRTKSDNKIIKACVPMHTFGHPVDIDGLLMVSSRWNIKVVEDSAESLGSLYKGRHTGTFGDLGVLSFNGNKIITTGGGGMILSNDAEYAARAKHLTTTAKISDSYEYTHDEIGYNYRLPNLNAALGCAQLEMLDDFIVKKRELANRYKNFFYGSEWKFFQEPLECRSNYWLNSVICLNGKDRDELLKATNAQGVMTRPIWTLMNNLSIYKDCRHGELINAQDLESRLVNLPSGVSSPAWES